MTGPLVASAVLQIPVDPSSPDAQQWILGELAKAPYQAAKPTWFDLASKAVQDWITSLFQGPGGNAGPVLLAVVVIVITGLIVAAFLIFGRPHLNRRTADGRRALFGDDDRRTADELRASAAAAARVGDWAQAIEERFRAIAQSLDERTIVSVTPGTTAVEFAARTALAVPEERDELTASARAFDEVRYLERPGDEGQYRRLVSLDERLRAARPRILEPAMAGTPGTTGPTGARSG